VKGHIDGVPKKKVERNQPKETAMHPDDGERTIKTQQKQTSTSEERKESSFGIDVL